MVQITISERTATFLKKILEGVSKKAYNTCKEKEYIKEILEQLEKQNII